MNRWINSLMVDSKFSLPFIFFWSPNFGPMEVNETKLKPSLGIIQRTSAKILNFRPLLSDISNIIFCMDSSHYKLDTLKGKSERSLWMILEQNWTKFEFPYATNFAKPAFWPTEFRDQNFHLIILKIAWTWILL